MLTFQEFLAEAARRGRSVNILFEEQIFRDVGLIDRIAGVLEKANIPYELIGGMAVFIHVNKLDPASARTSDSVDLMIRRVDLPRVIEAAERTGFVFRRAARVDMLLYGGDEEEAVHLVFAGEKVKPNQIEPNLDVNPIRERIHGTDVWMILVPDLIRMKLSSNRLSDQVQIQDMDHVGLITPEIERDLPPQLQQNLKRIRDTR